MAARERGFALLLVLWSLVLIALLTTQLLASGRTSLRLAGNLRAAAQAQASADGAIHEALFHVLTTGPDHWPQDNTPHLLRVGAYSVSVRVQNLADKINPNLASTGLLSGLFQALGAAPDQAQHLANAIIAWRSKAVSKQDTQALLAAYRRPGLPYGPPGQPFADLSDLGDVIDMSPALLAAALPHMSLYPSGDPAPTLADPIVRRALAISGQAGANSNFFESTAQVISITAEASGPAGLDLRRIAIISLGSANASAPFQILSLY
jgi:general secretion pathway protein K